MTGTAPLWLSAPARACAAGRSRRPVSRSSASASPPPRPRSRPSLPGASSRRIAASRAALESSRRPSGPFARCGSASPARRDDLACSSTGSPATRSRRSVSASRSTSCSSAAQYHRRRRRRPGRGRGARPLGPAALGAAPADVRAGALRALPHPWGGRRSRSRTTCAFVEVGAGIALVGRPLRTLRRAGRYHQPAAPPLFVAEGVGTLADAPSLRRLYRSHAWVLPLEDDSLHVWEADAFRGAGRPVRARRAAGQSALRPRGSGRRGRASGRDGGRRRAAAAPDRRRGLRAPVAFSLLAAATLRRDAGAARRRLTWFGAAGGRSSSRPRPRRRRSRLPARSSAGRWEPGSRPRRDRAGAPIGDVLAETVLSGTGLVAGLLLAAVSALVLFAAVRARPVRLGGLSVSPLDVAALGAVAVIVVTFAPRLDRRRALAQEGGTGALLLLLPGLVAFVAAVASRALLVPGLRALERFARGRRRRPPPRRALARAEPGLRGRRHRVPHGQPRPRALRRDLPLDACRAGRRTRPRSRFPPTRSLSEDLRELVLRSRPATLDDFRSATQVARRPRCSA